MIVNRATDALSREGELTTIYAIQATYADGLLEEITIDLHLQ